MLGNQKADFGNVKGGHGEWNSRKVGNGTGKHQSRLCSPIGPKINTTIIIINIY